MKWFGINTIYGVDGEHETPYMTRIKFGTESGWGFRIHIFHRGDADPDCHDHPWSFWTFPLTTYMEEVVEQNDVVAGGFILKRQVVRAFHWHYRAAEHTHRVLARCSQQSELQEEEWGEWVRIKPWRLRPGQIITIVTIGSSRRDWGFLKNRGGEWCWTPWKEYVFGGGKHAACEPNSHLTESLTDE